MDKPKKKDWTAREGKRFLFETSLICNMIALVCLFLSFVSPYWIVSWPRVFSQFKQIGLWEVCLAGLVLEMDPTQKAYHGCWWILAPEFSNIRYWLMPPWFVWTQVAVTFCFVAQMCLVGLMIFIWIRTGMTQRDPKIKRRKDPIILLNISAITTFCSTIVMVITLITFAIMFKTDYNWFPHPNLNYLSWSYGLAIVSAFFTIFASIGLFTYLSIIRNELRQAPMTDPMAPVTGLWPQSSGLAGSTSQINRSKDAGSKSSRENLNQSKEKIYGKEKEALEQSYSMEYLGSKSAGSFSEA